MRRPVPVVVPSTHPIVPNAPLPTPRLWPLADLRAPTTPSGSTRLRARMAVAVSCLGLVLATGAARAELPADIAAALERAQIDRDSLAVFVVPLGPGNPAPRLAHQADRAVNPASLMKVVTSAVALERLGPTFTWQTPVYLDGPVRGEVLDGNLILEGRGDPRLVTERVWLLLRRVQQQFGVREIRGDIVLDRQAFNVPEGDPGAFDGERHRPYNVQPDALMLNQKAVVLTLRPEAERGAARVSLDPPLAGVQTPAEVPLAKGACAADWRGALGADFSDPTAWRLSGRYAASCGERQWPVAPADPARFNARLVEGLWRDMGGRLQGRVRDGVRPAGLVPAFELSSPSLPEVLRDMNKYSNNVIAHQVMLTIGLQQRAPATFEHARELVRQTVQERAGCAAEELRPDRGSGLSRDERITARCLGRVLQWIWSSPWMPELVSSLPLAGETTARRALSAAGRAHLKTGSLHGVAALAGFVDAPSGRRHGVVAILNHPRAGSDEARAALDSVVRWTLEEKDLTP